MYIYQGLTLSFFRYLSKGQVNLYFTCPRAQVTCLIIQFFCTRHYILVQITNVITIDLIMMYPLFKTYSLNMLLLLSLYQQYTLYSTHMNTCTSAKVHIFHTPKTHPPTRSHTRIYTRKLETHTHAQINTLPWDAIPLVCKMNKMHIGGRWHSPCWDEQITYLLATDEQILHGS